MNTRSVQIGTIEPRGLPGFNRTHTYTFDGSIEALDGYRRMLRRPDVAAAPLDDRAARGWIRAAEPSERSPGWWSCSSLRWRWRDRGWARRRGRLRRPLPSPSDQPSRPSVPPPWPSSGAGMTYDAIFTGDATGATDVTAALKTFLESHDGSAWRSLSTAHTRSPISRSRRTT